MTVIAGVNLNNLKANHNPTISVPKLDFTVIAGVNLNNLKANHNNKERQRDLSRLLSLA